MKKQLFLGEATRLSAELAGLDATASIVRAISEDFAVREPRWWQLALQAWGQRGVARPRSAWLLLLQAIHFEGLRNSLSPLRPFLPSCGGRPGRGLSAAVIETLEQASTSFYTNIEQRPIKRLGQAWSSLWTTPAARFFQNRQLPFYFAELGAATGLNGAADLVWPHDDFDSELIYARVGLMFYSAFINDQIPDRPAFEESIAMALKDWDDRGLWVDFEREGSGEDLTLNAYHLDGGRLACATIYRIQTAEVSS